MGGLEGPPKPPALRDREVDVTLVSLSLHTLAVRRLDLSTLEAHGRSCDCARMSLYTPRQLLLILLIVAAVGAGLAIDHARRARPDLVEQLERLDRVERAEPAPPRSPTAATDTPGASGPAARAVRESRRDRAAGEEPRDPPSDTAGPRGRRSREAVPDEPVDINRASEPELVRLPGVGPALAARIVAARPFGDVDDLRRVRGVRTILFERLRPLIVALP